MGRQCLGRVSLFRHVRWHCIRFFQSHQVKFHTDVHAVEFSRHLDGGDTIPGDGTIVTLGLGKKVGVSTVPLASQPPKRRAPVEERAWLTSSKRAQVLRKSMGDKSFFGAWQHHKSMTRKIIRERAETQRSPGDVSYMPASLVEARVRAARFAAEAYRPCWESSQKIASSGESDSPRWKYNREAQESPQDVAGKIGLKRKRSATLEPKQLASPLKKVCLSPSASMDTKEATSPLRVSAPLLAAHSFVW